MNAPRKLPIGVLISGSGTNLQQLIDHIREGFLDAEIRVVISDKATAYGLERARAAGIPAVHIDPADFADRGAFNEAIRDELVERGVEYVVMAGYMRLLGTQVLEAFPNRVLNIHPALLPSFAGAHGIKDAFDHGVKVAGVTVHFANEVFDEGPIIAQEAVPVLETDTIESLEERIHNVEYRLYPRVLQLIAENRVRIVGRKVHIDD